MSTKVLFPRFEYEAPGNDVNGTVLVQRSKQRHFLIADKVLSDVVVPAPYKFPQSKPINNKGNWWGVYATKRVSQTPHQAFVSPLIADALVCTRLKFENHDYRWDEQAFAGHSTEVVVEQIGKSGFEEVAALLVTRDFQGYDTRLVMTDEAGAWAPQELSYEATCRAAFYMGVITELCQQDETLPEAIAVDVAWRQVSGS